MNREDEVAAEIRQLREAVEALPDRITKSLGRAIWKEIVWFICGMGFLVLIATLWNKFMK